MSKLKCAKPQLWVLDADTTIGKQVVVITQTNTKKIGVCENKNE